MTGPILNKLTFRGSSFPDISTSGHRASGRESIFADIAGFHGGTG